MRLSDQVTNIHHLLTNKHEYLKFSRDLGPHMTTKDGTSNTPKQQLGNCQIGEERSKMQKCLLSLDCTSKSTVHYWDYFAIMNMKQEYYD